MYLLLLAIWATCFVLAWIGAGRAFLRLLNFTELSWPFSGVAGASLFVFAGGLLNLAGLVHRPALIAMVVLGDALFLIQLAAARNQFSKHRSAFLDLPVATRVLAVLCALALIVISVGSLHFSQFSIFDDLPAYITFPAKLFQLGSLPFDPFSERRVQSGLGANYFLQAFMLVAGDVRSLWFIDAGAGLFLFAGCIYRAGRRLGNSILLSLVLVILVLLVPLSHGNLGMTVLPAAIFTAMFLAETADETSSTRKSVLLGLLAAAVSLLKSTYLPAALLILPCLHLLRTRHEPLLRTIRDVLISAFAFLVVVLPWMLDMKRKEGTLLYPLLGKGDEISAYGAVPHLVNPGYYPAELGLAVLLVFVAAAVVHWMAAREYKHAAQVSTLLLVSGLVTLPISISVAASSLIRYTAPFELPFVLLLLGSLMRVSAKRPISRRLLGVSYAFAGMLILGLEGYAITHGHFALYAQAAGHKPGKVAGGIWVLTANGVRDQQRLASNLQNAIPPGQAVYADFMITFPMNFQRNQILIADFPGMSSLPPGMPTQGKPTALRVYLIGRSIRFIAYSSKLATLREAALLWPRPRSGSWPYMQSLTSVDVDHEISSLAQTYRVIYDDGDEKVIDLLQPQPTDHVVSPTTIH